MYDCVAPRFFPAEPLEVVERRRRRRRREPREEEGGRRVGAGREREGDDVVREVKVLLGVGHGGIMLKFLNRQ